MDNGCNVSTNPQQEWRNAPKSTTGLCRKACRDYTYMLPHKPTHSPGVTKYVPHEGAATNKQGQIDILEDFLLR